MLVHSKKFKDNGFRQESPALRPCGELRRSNDFRVARDPDPGDPDVYPIREPEPEPDTPYPEPVDEPDRIDPLRTSGFPLPVLEV